MGDTKSGVLCLGFFDGVHKGHQLLIDAGLQEARRRGVLGCVYTFDVPPCKKLEGEITPLSLKAEILEEMGVDALYIDTFSSLREMSPRAFVEEILIRRLKAVCVVTGFNYTFGYKGAGDTKLLREICREHGVDTIEIPKIVIERSGVASRRIRKYILGGNMEMAQKLLGRPFSIKEKVILGRQIGRRLDVPTINQMLPKGSIAIPVGVYMTRTVVGEKKYLSVTNVGTSPTVGDFNDIRVETHILDFSQDLYDLDIKVEFLRKIREEKKFKSLEDLKKQLNRDIELVRTHSVNYLK
jgi:riboflavin kinase/FMN adenylyltransferase